MQLTLLSLAITRTGQVRSGVVNWTPATLFANGEKGAWYDPSDFSTMFQDSAGTTPVTAVEQPVGRILDKSGRGNHATQTTATSRPILQQDASGRYYLRFDGVDDWLVTPSINFTGTDKMTVFAGVRKLLDVSAVLQIVCELSAATTSNIGSFNLRAPSGAVNNNDAAFSSRGDGVIGNAQSVVGSYPSPITLVLTGTGNISADSAVLRVNGVFSASGSEDQGGGNYGNYPLYIGRRGGTANPFNGHIYSMIVRGAQSTAQQIASAEAWVNGKTGAY